MQALLEGANLSPLNECDDLIEQAQGDDEDLDHLLKYLLGENMDERSL
jgi:hypothetical protein